MHGKGQFFWPDGTRYEGSYENDLKQGQGTFYFNDKHNSYWVGEWQRGKQNGPGKLIVGTKEKSGIWIEGAR